MRSLRAEPAARRPPHLTRARNSVNHPFVIRTIVSSLRCALAAMLAIAIVAARPSMLTAHAMSGMQHGCGMAMQSHQHTSPDHGCSKTTRDACCDDCMCAGPIGSDVKEPLVVIVETYRHVAIVIEHPTEVVRSRRQPALRLPPPLGPPLITRS
jgi:hypothetical protein